MTARPPFPPPPLAGEGRGGGGGTFRVSPTLRGRARALRRDMTRAERALWRLLRDQQLAGARFRRQHPVPPCVLDFACVEARLVVEVDGGQHGGARDAARDTALAARGWRTLRVWNNEAMENPEGVRLVILSALDVAGTPPP